jgi:nitroreductase
MELNELINMRQSVRKYTDQIVEDEKIKKCLEAARLAPSASNSQPWKYIVVDDPVLKNKVAEATFSKPVSFNKFALQAPVLVVIVLEKSKLITQIGGQIKNKEWALIDIGISTEHFCLQATELDLGTCMIGWFNENRIKELLHIPENKTIGLVITLGYPPKDYPLRDKIRKSISEISTSNKY